MWLKSQSEDRKELIESLTTDTYHNETVDGVPHSDVKVCLEHCYRGNSTAGVIWSVWQRTKTTGNNQKVEKYIGCDIIKFKKRMGWVYRRTVEVEGPPYYSCPMKYLDMVPQPTGDKIWATRWREQVRQRRGRNGKSRIVKGFLYEARPGTTWKNETVETIRVISLKPTLGEIRTDKGTVMRVKFPKRCIGKELPLPMWQNDQED